MGRLWGKWRFQNQRKMPDQGRTIKSRVYFLQSARRRPLGSSSGAAPSFFTSFLPSSLPACLSAFLPSSYFLLLLAFSLCAHPRLLTASPRIIGTRLDLSPRLLLCQPRMTLSRAGATNRGLAPNTNARMNVK